MDQTALGESRDESKVLGPKFWPHRPKINNDETASLVQEAESTNKARLHDGSAGGGLTAMPDSRHSPNKLGEKMGTGEPSYHPRP